MNCQSRVSTYIGISALIVGINILLFTFDIFSPLFAFYVNVVTGGSFVLLMYVNQSQVLRRLVNIAFLYFFFVLIGIHALESQIPEVHTFFFEYLWGRAFLFSLGLGALAGIIRHVVPHKDFRSNKEKKTASTDTKFSLRRISFISLYIVGGLTFLGLATYNLGSFITVDEPRWINYFDNGRIKSPDSLQEARDSGFIDTSYARSVAYWNSYLSGDFNSAMTNGESGATTNFLHLIAYFFQDTPLEQYLFLSRITFVIHNLILIGLGAFLVARVVSSRNNGIIFFLITVLFPLVVGYSRIVNHDSINGLYILVFFLAFILSLKEKSRKWAFWGGIFAGLAVTTSGKGHYVVPFLWFIPLIGSVVYHIPIKTMTLRVFQMLPYYFLGGFISMAIVLPAMFFYPELFFKSLLLPEGILFWATSLTFFLFITVGVVYPFKIEGLRIVLKENQWWIVRIGVILLFGGLGTFIWSVFHKFEIGELLNGYFTFVEALESSFIYWFFAQPLLLIGFLGAWGIAYMIRPRLDVSFISMMIFFGLILMGVMYTSSTTDDASFLPLNTRYLMIFIYFYLLALGTSWWVRKVSWKVITFVGIGVIVVLTWNNISAIPHYVLFNNFLFPEGHILATSHWGFGIYKSAEYINEKFTNVTIYDGSGRMQPLMKNGNKALEWSKPYWKYSTDYVAIFYDANNHQSHRFKDRFQFYKKNKKPVWKYYVNGTGLVELYKKVPTKNVQGDIIQFRKRGKE